MDHLKYMTILIVNIYIVHYLYNSYTALMSRPSGIFWLRLCSNLVTTCFTEVCKSSFERMIERGEADRNANRHVGNLKSTFVETTM